LQNNLNNKDYRLTKHKEILTKRRNINLIAFKSIVFMINDLMTVGVELKALWDVRFLISSVLLSVETDGRVLKANLNWTRKRQTGDVKNF